MQSTICTLYEGNYHYGVAVLVNSLYSKGFRGDFYIGYRGELPPWAKDTIPNTNLNWENAQSFKAADDLLVHFLPVETESHFTNYKPYFVKELIDSSIIKNEIYGIFYFDPDIVNLCEWRFYEEWITYGVAMVHEVVWNDMPHNHPKRKQWLQNAKPDHLKVLNPLNSYINAGFFGLSLKNLSFLDLWIKLIDYCESKGNFDKTKFAQSEHDYALLKVGDQDLFNLAAMCTECPLSEFGPDGMGFIGGGWLMAHATGSPKPWQVNFRKNWVSGKKVNNNYKRFWEQARGVISCYNVKEIKRKQNSIKLYSLLSRFYSK
ncbi:MAG: hypothetical protein WBG71_11205 [Leeuwenhoekiella sp.]